MGSGAETGGLDDLGWWQGKALLAGMSLLLQKFPVSMLGLLFRLERNRRRAEAMELKPYKACGVCKIPRIFAVVPWVVFVLFVVACFGTTIILTSTGFLQTMGTEHGTADGLVEGTGGGSTHCGCAGITDGKDVESDWITLLMMVVLFRTLVYVRRETKRRNRENRENRENRNLSVVCGAFTSMCSGRNELTSYPIFVYCNTPPAPLGFHALPEDIGPRRF